MEIPSQPRTVLITGGAGFFGGLLKERLLSEGYRCVSVDLVKDDMRHEQLISIQGSIGNREVMEPLFQKYQFASVFHVAAILAHDRKNHSILWESNVDATKLLLELCRHYNVP